MDAGANFLIGSHLGDSFFAVLPGESFAEGVSVADDFLSGFIRGIGHGEGFLTNVIHLVAAFFVISQLLLILANGDAS